MLKAGKTAVEISREINRTPGAIYSRVQRILQKATFSIECYLLAGAALRLLSSSTSGEPGTKPFS